MEKPSSAKKSISKNFESQGSMMFESDVEEPEEKDQEKKPTKQAKQFKPGKQFKRPAARGAGGGPAASAVHEAEIDESAAAEPEIATDGAKTDIDDKPPKPTEPEITTDGAKTDINNKRAKPAEPDITTDKAKTDIKKPKVDKAKAVTKAAAAAKSGAKAAAKQKNIKKQPFKKIDDTTMPGWEAPKFETLKLKPPNPILVPRVLGDSSELIGILGKPRHLKP